MSVDTAIPTPAPALPAPAVTHLPADTLRKLRAVVLLAGSVRSNSFRSAIGRSFLELPVEADVSVLDHWCKALSALAKHLGMDSLSVRVLVDRATRLPIRAIPTPTLRLNIERDRVEYRGTGGLLRDLAGEYEDDDLLLIANAAQFMLDPLPQLAEALTREPGDFSILVSGDGEPTGLKLARCGCLRMIPPVGFVDLKEQALPRIARERTVRVVRLPEPCSMPIRTAPQYVAALREHHWRKQDGRCQGSAFDEDWQRAFALIEPGARVHPSAVVHDSVVLDGATVGAGAVLARSVVCPTAKVRPRQSIIDSLASGAR